LTVALFAVAIFAFACKPARRAAPPSMPIALPDDWTPGGPYAGRITCLFAEGENLFAGGWHTGVFRSADGRNWTPFNDGMTGNRDVLALAGDGRALYAATLAGELFTNENGAWRIVREFGPGRRGALRALAYADGALIVGAGDGVHLTRDGGRSWRQIWSGADVTSLAVAPFSPGRLFFGTAGSGVGSCAADGADCRLAGAFPGGKSIVALHAGASELFAVAEGDGIFTTRDGRAFARVDLRRGEIYPLAVLVDGDRLAVSLQGEGLWLASRARPSAGRLLRFPRALMALVEFRRELFFGSDGLGVFAVEGESLRAANQGLLNFPQELVDEALRGSATRTPPTPPPPRKGPG